MLYNDFNLTADKRRTMHMLFAKVQSQSYRTRIVFANVENVLLSVIHVIEF